MTRCKHCLSPDESDRETCPVCGIGRNNAFADLSADEKKVRFFARVIRVWGMLHLIGALFGLITVFKGYAPPLLGIFSSINIPIAFGLAGFNYWGYRLAVTYYFLIGMVCIISIELFGVFLTLLSLYLVGNKTSKAIFERTLPE